MLALQMEEGGHEPRKVVASGSYRRQEKGPLLRPLKEHLNFSPVGPVLDTWLVGR